MSDGVDPARSFGRAADVYEAARPSYPVAAVEWLLDGLTASPTILDVGAGTGKLTRIIGEVVPHAASIVAIDPDLSMLDVLRPSSAGTRCRAVGTAEALPVADRSADAVLLGQAWHWVDAAAATAEIGRVLRDDGVLGMIWNVRDERVDWVLAMSDAITVSAGEHFATHPELITVGEPFGALESFRVDWERPMTRSQIVEMVRSRSHYLTATAARRREIEADLAVVLDGQPELAAGAAIGMPYTTRAFRAHRRSR